MDFICSLFQLYKYYLHVMGFWPLPVETKSITHELLNLQSFKIPDSLWHRGRTMETCLSALSWFISFLSFFFWFSLFIPPRFLLFLSACPLGPLGKPQSSFTRHLIFGHQMKVSDPSRSPSCSQGRYTWVCWMQVSRCHRRGRGDAGQLLSSELHVVDLPSGSIFHSLPQHSSKGNLVCL